MNIDERLDRLTERHEALTQSVEMLNRDIRELRAVVEIDAENIRRLAHIAEIHERRLSDLEGEG
jgi:prefoldin subunit 5